MPIPVFPEVGSIITVSLLSFPSFSACSIIARPTLSLTEVVEFLNEHKDVAKVNHPSLATGRQAELYKKYYPNGGGSIFTFEINGDANLVAE